MHISVRCRSDFCSCECFFYCVDGRKRRVSGQTLQSMLIFSSWFYMLYITLFLCGLWNHWMNEWMNEWKLGVCLKINACVTFSFAFFPRFAKIRKSFARLCGNTLKVWWEILYWFCWKFSSLFSEGTILKFR